jgi:hypothetical protein
LGGGFHPAGGCFPEKDFLRGSTGEGVAGSQSSLLSSTSLHNIPWLALVAGSVGGDTSACWFSLSNLVQLSAGPFDKSFLLSKVLDKVLCLGFEKGTGGLSQ